MRADRRKKFCAALRALILVAGVLAAGCMAKNAGYRPSMTRPRANVEKVGRRPPVVAIPQFDDAVALVGKLKYVEAEAKFRQLAAWYEAGGDKARAAECTFWVGFCLEKQRRVSDARAQYDKTTSKFPGTSAARMAARRRRQLPDPAPTNRGRS